MYSQKIQEIEEKGEDSTEVKLERDNLKYDSVIL